MDAAPPPDPQKLLSYWMEWERGDLPPGRVIANLKTAGLRQLLEQLGARDPAGPSEPAGAPPGANA